MIYGQDLAVRYPVKDLYDTGMMNLYITAIKDEYERGIKEQEEFISKYGDFISPFLKDVENWDRLTMDPIIEAYDYLQKNGIDPLRSQEGRALLADIRRKVPREKLSMLRQSAAAGQEYLSNRAKLQAAGQYDPEFEQFLLGDRTFEGQDTLSQGMWDRTAPTEFKGLRTLTDPWFKNRTAKYKGTKGGYDYYGYDVNDMKTATNDQIQAFLSNDYGRYYYNQALKVAQASRQPGESDESVRKRALEILIDDIVDVNRDYLMYDRKVNPIYLENLLHSHALARQRAAAARKGSGTEKNEPYNYHQSLLIRGALSLIPGGGEGYYAKYGADLSAAAASYNVKQATLDWKEKNAKNDGRGHIIINRDYKKKFLDWTGGLTESLNVLLARLGGVNGKYAVNRNTNQRSVILSEADLRGIESTDTYVLNSLGYTGKKRNDTEYFKRKLAKGLNLIAAPTGQVYTKMDADGRLKQYGKYKIYTSKLQYDNEDDPNEATSVEEKYLQTVYIPIQHTDAVPNNSLDTPIYPAQSTYSYMDYIERVAQREMGLSSSQIKFTNSDARL